MLPESVDEVRLPAPVDEAVELLAKQIRSEPLVQSSLVAISTAKLLRAVVSSVALRGETACIDAVQAVGRRLHRASPLVLVVENTVRRVLRIIREEFELCATERLRATTTASQSNARQQKSAAALASAPISDGLNDDAEDDAQEDGSLPAHADGLLPAQGAASAQRAVRSSQTERSVAKAARRGIMSSIEEHIEEIASASDNIVEQAVGHIYANEVVLVYGGSVTVELFLLEAAKKRKFEVIVAEHAPHCGGHALARKLACVGGLNVTLVPDAAVFAVMSRVHKVILGAHAVMANGGLMASCGAHMTAAAAKLHAKPVVVCVGLYKLTPLFPHDRDSLNEMLSPGSLVSYGELAGTRNIHVVNPAFDHVPPELVTLFITNNGGYIPAFMYRLLREYYNNVDTQL